MRSHQGVSSLARHPDFLPLWRAQTLPVFSSQITTLALTLTAAVTLHATPLEMGLGLLSTAFTLPVPLFVLFAGVFTDRQRRRPLLIGTDLLRAVFLAAIPMAALVHVVSLPLLAILGFLTSACSIVFDVAYQPYLPSIVRADQLIEGNGKLEVSSALAAVAVPGLAGGLVTLLGAPVAVALDAASFIGSALLLGQVRQRERPPVSNRDRPSLWWEMQAGFSVVLRHEILRPLAIFWAIFNFFGQVVEVSLIRFTTRTLGLSAALLGLIGAALPGWSLRGSGLVRHSAAGKRAVLSGPVERGVPGAAAQPAATRDAVSPVGPDECQHPLPDLGHDAAGRAGPGHVSAAGGGRGRPRVRLVVPVADLLTRKGGTGPSGLGSA